MFDFRVRIYKNKEGFFFVVSFRIANVADKSTRPEALPVHPWIGHVATCRSSRAL